MKKLSCFLVFNFLLAAHVPAAPNPASSSFVHLTGREWLTMDPANAFDTVSFILTGNVYESLITFRDARTVDSFEPFLAAQVSDLSNGLLSSDLMIYRFPIRQDVYFHDGSTMTAQDVQYSFLRYMLTDTEGGPAGLLLNPILGVSSTRDASGKIVVSFKEAAAAVRVKDNDLVITLKKPDAAFLSLIASLPIVTSKKWAIAHGEWDGREETWSKINNRPAAASYFHQNMNGTGPFKLEKIDRQGKQVILTRHEKYWRSAAALEKVYFKTVTSPGVRLLMLEAGDADSGYLEPSQWPRLQRLKGIHLVSELPAHHLGEVFFFNFNIDARDNEFLGSGRLDGQGIPPDFFTNPDIRRAFALAFDYAKFFNEGMGRRATRACGPVPRDLPFGDKGEFCFEQNIKKAEELFQKDWHSGLWHDGFTLSVAYSADNATRQAAAEIFKESMEKLNPKFKIKIHPLPSPEFYEALEARKLPIFIAGYAADYPDARSYVSGLVHSQGYFPRFQGYANAKADSLIEEISSLADPKERFARYRRVSQIVSEDLPQFYTYSPKEFRVCRDWVLNCGSQDNTNNLHFNNYPYFYAYSKKDSRP
ncbi:MAG: ABC transporter substrate-binding protein [Elusimicrobia bacterium]|nr:ABC transporter substrate-binding protein [Elusimicrobiota bacterium]